MDEPCLRRPIDELDRAVVAQEQRLCDFPDRRRLALMPADGEEQLVLLRRQAGEAGLLVAPVEEAAERSAEGKELAVVGIFERHCRHLYIVARYIREV